MKPLRYAEKERLLTTEKLREGIKKPQGYQ